MKTQVEPLKEGDTRTLLSASAANELIVLVNALAKLRPGKGIKIFLTDAGLSIELDEFVQKQLLLTGDGEGGGGNGEQAPGTLKWRGAWSASASYEPNDIVIRKVPIAEWEKSNIGGTFLCVDNAPPGTAGPTEPGSESYWVTFARGAWNVLAIGDSIDPTAQYVLLVGDGSTPSITIKSVAYGVTATSRALQIADPSTLYTRISLQSGGVGNPGYLLIDGLGGEGTNGGRISISLSDISGAIKRDVKLREITIGGTNYMILASEGYTT